MAQLLPAEGDMSLLLAAVSAANPYRCTSCSAAFGRQEHLARHVRGHTKEKPFVCRDCGKSFSRMDVLSRHAASYHQGQHEFHGPGVSARACTECATSRSRCSRGDPCKRCSRRNLPCDYPAARKRTTRASALRSSQPSLSLTRSPGTQQSTDEGTALSDGQTDPFKDTIMLHPLIQQGQAVDSYISPSTAIPGRVSWTPAGDLVDGLDMSLQGGNDLDAYHHTNFYDLDHGGNSLTDQVVGMSVVNWMSPQYSIPIPDWASHLASMPYGMAEPSTPSVSLGLDVGEQRSGAQSIHAVRNNYCQPPLTTSPGRRLSSVDSPHPDQASSHTGLGSTTASHSTEGTFYVDGEAARTPFKGRCVRRRSSISRFGENFPSSQNGPGLEEGRVLPADAYANLCHNIRSAPGLRDIDLDMASFPSLAQFRACFCEYFRSFHLTYPFLRRDIAVYEQSTHWVLLLAVAAVGSKYIPGTDKERIREVLLRVLQRTLAERMQLSESDAALADEGDEVAVDLVILQAAVLSLICVLHSGAKASRRALVERHHVVEACREMELLVPKKCAGPESANCDSIEFVQSWLDSESRTRAGLMIWLVDAMFEFEFGCAPLLRLGDAKCPLPCREGLWDHPTGEGIKRHQQRTVTILEAVELLYMAKRLPPNLTDFSTGILVYAIYRRTKETVCQHQTELALWTPSAQTQPQSTPGKVVEETWPPSLPILSKWRNSACDCLDILHWNANGMIAAAGGWEHPAVFHLHLSRLLLLAPTDHLQILAYAAAPDMRNQRLDSAKAAKARSAVLQWALRDQYKARLSLIHAGALFWHVHRYSSSSFLEPFGVFMATLVLWGYSTSVRIARLHGSQGTSPPARDAEEAEEEVVDPAFFHIDRPCDDEVVQKFVRLGHRMAGHMARVGDVCGDGAPKKILRLGLRTLSGCQSDEVWESYGGLDLPAAAEERVIWGVERPLVRLLWLLARSTAG